MIFMRLIFNDEFVNCTSSAKKKLFLIMPGLIILRISDLLWVGFLD